MMGESAGGWGDNPQARARIESGRKAQRNHGTIPAGQPQSIGYLQSGAALRDGDAQSSPAARQNTSIAENRGEKPMARSIERQDLGCRIETRDCA